MVKSSSLTGMVQTLSYRPSFPHAHLPQAYNLLGLQCAAEHSSDIVSSRKVLSSSITYADPVVFKGLLTQLDQFNQVQIDYSCPYNRLNYSNIYAPNYMFGTCFLTFFSSIRFVNSNTNGRFFIYLQCMMEVISILQSVACAAYQWRYGILDQRSTCETSEQVSATSLFVTKKWLAYQLSSYSYESGID